MGATAPLRRVVALAAAGLLLGCGAAPVQPKWSVAPLLRLQHAEGVDAAALYRLGRYHQQRGELDAAAAAFARSLALDPAQLDARNAEAVLLASRGRLEQAAALLRQLAEDFPDQAQPLSNLGYVYYLQGLHTKAGAALAQALRREPGHAQAGANLALTRAAEGDSPASRASAGSSATAGTAGTPGTAGTAATAATSAAAAPAAAHAPLAAQTGQRLVQVAPNIFQLEARAEAAASGNLGAAITATVATAGGAATTSATAPTAPTVQIVNGNGVAGAGERTRQLLARQGIVDAAVVNQRGHTQRATVIEYLPARRADAERMGAALRGPARLLRVASLPGPLTLRLVLGSDQTVPAARKSAAPRTVAQRAPARRPPLANAALLSLASAAPHFTQE